MSMLSMCAALDQGIIKRCQTSLTTSALIRPMTNWPNRSEGMLRRAALVARLLSEPNPCTKRRPDGRQAAVLK